MSKKALFLLANGLEEIEAIAPIDIFRRAGLSVVMAAVTPDAQGTVTGAHGLRFFCDTQVAAIPQEESFDLVYFPGGMPGAATLARSESALSLARRCYQGGGWCCAICAAPMALDAAGLLQMDTEYTCYPGFEKRIQKGRYTGKFIQRSGRILTACGPGAALDFGLDILRNIGFSAVATQLAEGMQMRR